MLCTKYDVSCIRKGRVRWRDHFRNLVTTVGLNKVLDATFKTGLASPAWFVGLKANGTYLITNTMSSHPGWSEIIDYSETIRQALVLGAVSGGSVDNSASKATFSINANFTLYGAFLVDDDTKSGTTGVLYGVGDFSVPRAVTTGDTLRVGITLVQL